MREILVDDALYAEVTGSLTDLLETFRYNYADIEERATLDWIIKTKRQKN